MIYVDSIIMKITRIVNSAKWEDTRYPPSMNAHRSNRIHPKEHSESGMPFQRCVSAAVSSNQLACGIIDIIVTEKKDNMKQLNRIPNSKKPMKNVRI